MGNKTKNILIVLGSLISWIPFIGFDMVFPLLIIITKDVNKVRKWTVISGLVFSFMSSFSWMSLLLSLFGFKVFLYTLFASAILGFGGYVTFGIVGKAWLKIYSLHSDSKKRFFLMYFKIKIITLLKILLIFTICLFIISMPLFTVHGRKMAENQNVVRIIDIVDNIPGNGEANGININISTLKTGLLIGIIVLISSRIIIPAIWAWHLCKIGRRIERAFSNRDTT